MASADAPPFVPTLDRVLHERRAEAPSGSYSATLLADPVQAQRKIMEEAFELCLELNRPEIDRSLVAEEAADLVFHLLCGAVGAGVSWADIEAVLAERHGAAS